jgi:hypothetical protein
MTAKYDAEFTGAGGTSGETHHDWRFKSNGAVILFAQCTVANTDVDPPDARFQFHVVADVPCERQARFSGLDVVEDVSFGARGVVTGERYLDRRTVDIIWPRTAWYDTSGGLHDFRCPQPYTQIEQGTGPARVEATLGTAEGRSAFARGLAASPSTTSARSSPGTPPRPAPRSSARTSRPTPPRSCPGATTRPPARSGRSRASADGTCWSASARPSAATSATPRSG